MNSITTRQNEPDQLRKLLAEDEPYSWAKTLHGLQITFVVLGSAALSLAAVFCERWGPGAALYGALVAFIDFYGFDPSMAKLKSQGARIRENFDLFVLELPSSPFREPNVAVEDTLTLVDPIPAAKEKMKIDWYPTCISELPIGPARLICQRSSLQYDDRLRKGYKLIWSALAAVGVIALVTWGLVQDPSFYHFALVVAAALPALLFCIKQRELNEEARDKIARMRSFFDATWSQALSPGIAPITLTVAARHLQDELFDHRSQRPLVPNFYYYLNRSKNEQIMNDAATRYVSDYLSAHKK